MEFDINELRKQKRPLWMTNFGHESFADMLGGGGDLWIDRLNSPECNRSFGMEYEGDRK